MYSIRQNEQSEYNSLMTIVACTIHKEAEKNLKQMNNPTDEMVAEMQKEIGIAVGQVILDKVIDMTNDMDRDKLIRFLAEATSSVAIRTMNEQSSFIDRIRFLCKILPNI
jgi:hypothetical protein